MRYLTLILLFVSVNCSCQFINVIGGGNPILDSDTTKWYISPDGDENNDGHTPATAKRLVNPYIQNLDNINGVYPEAGDTVFFECDGTYRFRNNQGDGGWLWTGTDGNPIVITSYGTGAKPRLLGSDTITNWTNHSGNIWKGYKSDFDDYQSNSQPWFETNTDSIFWGNNQIQVSNIDSLYEAHYSNDTVYVYSTSDPSTAFASVEIPIARYAPLVLSYQDSVEYVIWDGLEVAYTRENLLGSYAPGGSPSGRELKGLEVRNCLIHHCREPNGSQGYGVYTNMSNVIIENNEIHNCGRRNISVDLPSGFNPDSTYNILIQDNYLHNGFHTTGLDVGNDGPAGTVLDSLVFIRNIVEDDSSIVAFDVNNQAEGMIVQTASASGAKIRGVYIQNNLYKYSTQSVLHLLLNTGHADNIIEDFYFNNNIIYDYAPNMGTDDMMGLIRIDSIIGTFTNINVKNNITYSSVTDGKHVYLGNNYTGTGLTMDYNLHYSTENSILMFYMNTAGGPDYYTQAQWATWKTHTGWEANSPTPADPSFKEAPDSLVVYSNSDAVDAGVAISGYTTDYEEKAVGDPPNIGAYERTQTYLGIAYDPSNWYVDATDGLDANSGHHPDSAKQTISALNGLTLAADDTVFFDGNEIYRGQISNPEDGASGQHVVFTISPYGSAVKPIITTAINESSTSDWVDQGGNLWLNEDANFTGANYNVGNLISSGTSIGYNRKLEADVDDTIGEFFYDTGTDDILVYCTSNPATYWGSIDVAINSSIVDGGSSDYITFDGLAFNWTGRHGISYNSATNDITVKNCDFNIIGGSENYDGAGFQLGNGIEFYTNNYTNITITGCYFENIFDASITPQYADPGLDLNNFYINGNVFVNVRYALELAWDTDGEIHTFHFNNNTCWRDGDYVFVKDNRWSTALEQMGFVTFYSAQNAANTDVDIYNNIFYYENLSNIASAGVRVNFYPLPAHIDIDYNDYYSPDAFSSDHCLGNYSGTEHYTLSSWQIATSQDGSGYNEDPTFKAAPTNFRIHSGSALKDAGVAVAEYTLDYEGVAVGSPPNIGAIETTED